MPCVLGVTITKAGVPDLTPRLLEQVCPDKSAVALVASGFDAHDAVTTLKALSGDQPTTLATFAGLSRDYRLIIAPRRLDLGSHAAAPSTDAAICGDVGVGRVFLNPDQYAAACRASGASAAVLMQDVLPCDQAPTRKRHMSELRTQKWAEATARSFAEAALPALGVVRAAEVPEQQKDAPQFNEGSTGCALLGVGHGEDQLSRIAYIERCLATEAAAEAPLCLVAARTATELLQLRDIASRVPKVTVVVVAPFPFHLARKGMALQADGQVENLWDPAMATDRQPLAPGCDCVMCARHTRGYMHHLLRVHEMNSAIILTAHNLRVTARMLGVA